MQLTSGQPALHLIGISGRQAHQHLTVHIGGIVAHHRTTGQGDGLTDTHGQRLFQGYATFVVVPDFRLCVRRQQAHQRGQTFGRSSRQQHHRQQREET
ncbi:hypothetical protein D3C71_1838760 [compost metagenome]